MRERIRCRALPWVVAVVGVLVLPGPGAAGTATAEGGEVTTSSALPAAVGDWSRPDAPRRIEGDGLFEYMNGAGELYMAYRFDHLEMYEYAAEGQPGILVELYRMEHPDDAYGLQSEDWTGEALALGELTTESRRALYGAGLLRLACGTLYARVLTDETPASREAVLELGGALATGCGEQRPPRVVEALPPTLGGADAPFELRQDRARFFRSYLVLNSAYYLASDDVFGLQHTDAGVIAEYRPPDGDHTTRVFAVWIRYANAERAAAGLHGFRRLYLGIEDAAAALPDRNLRAIEDGWVGVDLEDADLRLVFEAPDEATAGQLLMDLAGREKTP